MNPLRGLVKHLSGRSVNNGTAGEGTAQINPLRGLAKQISDSAVSRSLVEAEQNYRLGRMEADRGRWRTALKHYNAALPIQRERLGEDHPNAARTLNDIGIALMNIGEDYAALTAFKEALYIRQETLGPGDQDIAESLSNLTKLLHNVRTKENAGEHLSGQASMERPISDRLSNKIEKTIHEGRRKSAADMMLMEGQLNELLELDQEMSTKTV